jgi:hypothetical protein
MAKARFLASLVPHVLHLSQHVDIVGLYGDGPIDTCTEF